MFWSENIKYKRSLAGETSNILYENANPVMHDRSTKPNNMMQQGQETTKSVTGVGKDLSHMFASSSLKPTSS